MCAITGGWMSSTAHPVKHPQIIWESMRAGWRPARLSAGITGEIGISSKSVHMQNGSYVGTVTLTTDADLIRISRSVGNLTGNSAGSDGEYYYLRSGDAISITSSQSTFSITAQSVSSQDEEAFLIGIPNADIQKVIIPQYGLPAKNEGSAHRV